MSSKKKAPKKKQVQKIIQNLRGREPVIHSRPINPLSQGCIDGF